MPEQASKKLSLSIVSHGNRESAVQLLADLARLERRDFEVILTVNVPEVWLADFDAFPFEVRVIRNSRPKGFAANHNAAFAISQGENFVFINPDIRLFDDPFDILLAVLDRHPRAICAPLVLNETRQVEDSARNYPTPLSLCRKLAAKLFGLPAEREQIPSEGDLLLPDWVAGMFVLAPRAVYEQLHGLSERYHLYYEDVDFCARARLAGCEVFVCTRASVTHQAQRASHRKLRYLAWHLQSACKFFVSPAFLMIQKRRRLSARTGERS